MSITSRPYHAGTDFARVREFLSATQNAFGKPLNWDASRWTYARCFVCPMVGSLSGGESGGERAIRDWAAPIRIWETGDGEIVGVVCGEEPEPGCAFLQRHPDHLDLLPEMLTYAEEAYAHPKSGALTTAIFDDDELLRALARSRGYRLIQDEPDHISLYTISRPPVIRLPRRFALHSMADGGNVDLRREVLGRAFGNKQPDRWPSAYSYRQLQSAPGYRPDLDLYIVAPDGRYVSFCVAWYDEANRSGCFEPVGTHPSFRGIGLGRAVVWEGIHRLAALGASRAYVGSGQAFYQAIGFRRYRTGHVWRKKLE